jgi:hypothetical protein
MISTKTKNEDSGGRRPRVNADDARAYESRSETPQRRTLAYIVGAVIMAS